MTCLRCNGAGFVTGPAPTPRHRHSEPFRWTSPLGEHRALVWHGRTAARCEPCEGTGG